MIKLLRWLKLREKCPNLELFWSLFSCIRTKYGLKNSEYGHFSRSVKYWNYLQQNEKNWVNVHKKQSWLNFYDCCCLLWQNPPCRWKFFKKVTEMPILNYVVRRRTKWLLYQYWTIRKHLLLNRSTPKSFRKKSEKDLQWNSIYHRTFKFKFRYFYVANQ